MKGKQFYDVFRGRTKWSLMFVLTIMFFSCRKVIDVDIEGVEPLYVVEAVVTDQPGESKVLLSATKDVAENNQFPAVSGPRNASPPRPEVLRRQRLC